MGYTYLDGAFKGDAAFIAQGRSKEELFSACAEALLGMMIQYPDRVEALEHREVELQAESLEFLLHDFLQEILYRKDAEGLLLRPHRIAVAQDGDTWILRAELVGAPVFHFLEDWLNDVKAVTFHRFALREENGWWEATVVVDL